MQYFVQYCSCNTCHAGVSGSQLLGGLLLHTTRNTVTKSCRDKFSKLLTSCTYNHTLYDESTGEVVVLATTSGGLAPYGVDPFFLESSSTYDASLAVCKLPFPVRTLYRCTCTDLQHFLPLSLAPFASCCVHSLCPLPFGIASSTIHLSGKVPHCYVVS